MGNFFTSIQIQNHEQLVKEQFIELFCNKMKENGFVIGSKDDNEISYALLFSNNSKWVSVASEAYEQGNETVRKDAARLAKMMNAHCINITVVDSDFAMLDMYSNTGKKLDTAVIGRADDYMDDEIPAPKKTVWSALLSKDSTWECFMAVQQGDYVFVEDGLKELAPILGMDSRNILFDAEDATESDENTCFLYFKKTSTKTPKKLTLNAAFKQVFGAALEPLGFVKIKSKYPYFVRPIGDEIIQIIALEIRSYDSKYNLINILGGIETVYRSEINLSWPPKFLRERGLQNICDYYKNSDPDNYNREIYNKLWTFCIAKSASNERVIERMQLRLEEVEKWMLPVITKVTSLDSALEFFIDYSGPSANFYEPTHRLFNVDKDNESLLYFKVKDVNAIIKKFSDLCIQDLKINIKHGINDLTEDDYEKELAEIYNRMESFKSKIDILQNNEIIINEIKECKAKNIETLKSYGIEVK